jgi:hypothetical protein
MSILDKVIDFWTEAILSDSYISIPDKNAVLRRVKNAYTLLLTTNRNIIDIEEEIMERKLNQIERDFQQHNLIILKDILNMNDKELSSRFIDDFEGVKDRMFFRIELYKNGWTIEQIENYIYKYMLKKEAPCIDEIVRKNNYHNLMVVYFNINNNKNLKCKGRPKLPQSLEYYLKRKHADKVKDNMRKGYKKQDIFDTISNNLLTDDEIKLIESKFENKDEPVLLKIRELFIRKI